jgi:hypothetical protein
MDSISSEERDQIFKQALSSCDGFIKSKEYEYAYRAISKANLYLPYFRNDPFVYMLNLGDIKDRQAEICIIEETPKYDLYLIHSLESFALEIVRDLMMFPILAPFNKRKKIQYSPYYEDGCDSLEICPDKDGDLFISLKKMKIFQYREEMFKEYLDFIYTDMPEIYGIPSDFNDKTLNELLDKRDINTLYVLEALLPEKLNKEAIGTIPYEINKFITNLLKKYYDMGNP